MRGNLWGLDAPPESDPIGSVVYRSRLIGADSDLVVWGGGNTSVKTIEPDFRGRMREVLRIKGSGTDLKTVDAAGFPGIFRDDILPLLERDAMSDEEMVAYLDHCMVEPSGRRPSIETLLHGFLPAKHVDHVHADAIVTLTNTERGYDVVREVFGDRIAAVPYRRPGFLLSKEVHEAAKGHDAIVLMNHGLVTWGETGEESYRMTIELVERAERWLRAHTPETRPRSLPDRDGADLEALFLRIRGRLGRRIFHLDNRPEARAIVDRSDAEALAVAGPATADHVLRIRTSACVLRGHDPVPAIDEYEQRYRAFFQRYAEPGLGMLSPLPKVLLIPGAGILSAGVDAKDALITSDVAYRTLRAAAWGTDVHGSYRSFDEQHLFDVDYWPLELFKLTLAPPPRELAGRVTIVTGAASGIGRAIALHLASLGAQTVLFDLATEGLDETARLIGEVGGAAPACWTIDLTDEAAVSRTVREVVLCFGGIDGLVSNAGIGAAGMLEELTPEQWRRSLEVNTTSHFLMTAEVLRVMRQQGLGGSLVYVASKNAFGPGAGFGAYSAAKAAQVQLARIAALEGGPARVRSNIVNPDAVFEGSGLWNEDLRRERAAVHGVAVERLEDFYAQRNLLKTKIGGSDVAEAVAFLLSDRSKATTGTVIAVDGGVPGAFPR